MIAWASRAAGGIGVVTSVLYLGILIGEDDPSQMLSAFRWFALMAGAGLLALLADRARSPWGRRMVWVAFAMFLGLGVLSLFSIGILYLAASLLALFSLSGWSGRSRAERVNDGH